MNGSRAVAEEIQRVRAAAAPQPTGAVLRYIRPLVPGAAYECANCGATDPDQPCPVTVSGWHWMARSDGQ